MATPADGGDEPLAVLPRGSVLDGGVGEARVAAELARPVVVHDGERVRHVGRHVTRTELPNEMVANLNHRRRSTNVLRPYPARLIKQFI